MPTPAACSRAFTATFRSRATGRSSCPSTAAATRPSMPSAAGTVRGPSSGSRPRRSPARWRRSARRVACRSWTSAPPDSCPSSPAWRPTTRRSAAWRRGTSWIAISSTSPISAIRGFAGARIGAGHSRTRSRLPDIESTCTPHPRRPPSGKTRRSRPGSCRCPSRSPCSPATTSADARRSTPAVAPDACGVCIL